MSCSRVRVGYFDASGSNTSSITAYGCHQRRAISELSEIGSGSSSTTIARLSPAGVPVGRPRVTFSDCAKPLATVMPLSVSITFWVICSTMGRGCSATDFKSACCEALW